MILKSSYSRWACIHLSSNNTNSKHKKNHYSTEHRPFTMDPAVVWTLCLCVSSYCSVWDTWWINRGSFALMLLWSISQLWCQAIVPETKLHLRGQKDTAKSPWSLHGQTSNTKKRYKLGLLSLDLCSGPTVYFPLPWTELWTWALWLSALSVPSVSPDNTKTFIPPAAGGGGGGDKPKPQNKG